MNATTNAVTRGKVSRHGIASTNPGAFWWGEWMATECGRQVIVLHGEDTDAKCYADDGGSIGELLGTCELIESSMKAAAMEPYPFAARVQPDLTITFPFDSIQRHAPWIRKEHVGSWAEVNGRISEDILLVKILLPCEKGPVWTAGVTPYAPKTMLWKTLVECGAENMDVAA